MYSLLLWLLLKLLNRLLCHWLLLNRLNWHLLIQRLLLDLLLLLDTIHQSSYLLSLLVLLHVLLHLLQHLLLLFQYLRRFLLLILKSFQQLLFLRFGVWIFRFNFSKFLFASFQRNFGFTIHLRTIDNFFFVNVISRLLNFFFLSGFRFYYYRWVFRSNWGNRLNSFFFLFSFLLVFSSRLQVCFGDVFDNGSHICSNFELYFVVNNVISLRHFGKILIDNWLVKYSWGRVDKVRTRRSTAYRCRICRLCENISGDYQNVGIKLVIRCSPRLT